MTDDLITQMNWTKTTYYVICSEDLKFQTSQELVIKCLPLRWWRTRLRALPARQSSVRPRTGRAPRHRRLSDAPICQETLRRENTKRKVLSWNDEQSWKKKIAFESYWFCFEVRYFYTLFQVILISAPNISNMLLLFLRLVKKKKKPT